MPLDTLSKRSVVPGTAAIRWNKATCGRKPGSGLLAKRLDREVGSSEEQARGLVELIGSSRSSPLREGLCRRRSTLVHAIETAEDFSSFVYWKAGAVVGHCDDNSRALVRIVMLMAVPGAVCRIAFSTRLANSCVSSFQSPRAGLYPVIGARLSSL